MRAYLLDHDARARMYAIKHCICMCLDLTSDQNTSQLYRECEDTTLQK